MSKKYKSFENIVDPKVYKYILTIFNHFQDEIATIKFKEQFFGGIENSPYPNGEVGLEIEGSTDFPCIIKIQIKKGYLQLKIFFANKTSDYVEVQLRYYRSLRKDFKLNGFFIYCKESGDKLTAMEGFDLFIQKSEQNFKVYSKDYYVVYKEY